MGATTELQIAPHGEPDRTVSITLAFENVGPAPEPRPDKIAEIEPGIYYIDISRITDADFNKALPQLETAHGIVFDFRGYPGTLGPSFLSHLSDKSMTSAQWHVPLVTRPDWEPMQFERRPGWDMPPLKPSITAKKAFITDARAISYAESCMGIVENYRLGEIVGAPTAGTNGNVNPLPLPGGYTIAWTGMKVLKHDGSRHHGIGIQPTIPVSRTRAAIAAGRDEMLDRAIQSVRQ